MEILEPIGIVINSKAGVVLTGLTLTMVLLIIVGLAHYYSFPNDGYWVTVLIGLFGITLGCLVGSMVSPKSTTELTMFQTVAGAIATFASGYILGQLGPLTKTVFEEGILIQRPVYGFRVIVFAIFLIAAAIHFYVFRAYMEGAFVSLSLSDQSVAKPAESEKSDQA